MRFLLNERRGHRPDPRIVHGLTKALAACGHDVYVSNVSPGTRPPQVYDGIDVAIEINQPRDEAVPADIVHIAWVQDYVQGEAPDFGAACCGQDLIYTFGDGPLIGAPSDRWPNCAGSLLTAADEQLMARAPSPPPDLDFSIVGFIPPSGDDWWIPRSNFDNWSDHILELFAEMRKAMEGGYGALQGSFAPVAGMDSMRNVLRACAARWGQDGAFADKLWGHFEPAAGKFMHEYARLMDRRLLADLALGVSESVEFRGWHWDTHPKYARWARPHVADDETVLRTYERSRITLHNNIFGFALHTRVLEAMAVGTFVMAHPSPNPHAAGRISETFMPGLHYGEYTPESFAEQAREWLDDDEARVIAAIGAQKIVRDRHLWKHRARQILRDLGIKGAAAA